MHGKNIDNDLIHLPPWLETLQLYGAVMSPDALSRLTTIEALKVS